MTSQPSEAEVLDLAIQELDEQIRAQQDPCFLISRMVGVDQRDGTRFTFQHLADPLEPGEVELEGSAVRPRDRNWRWQRWLAEQALDSKRLIVLKGRQIGATWVLLAVDVAEALLLPGTTSLLYRQREDEAIDNIRRWWTLYQSLPEHLRFGTVVVTPARSGDRPGSSGIVLKHPDGRLSEIVPMTSAAASGHGRTVRRVLLDEGAYIEKLAEIGAAVEPAAGGAAIAIISTAKGRSNLETGEGNEFHRRWVDAEDSGYTRVFLPFSVHPDRDEEWYENATEIRSLRLHQRQEQFPRDEHEAFALSDQLYFDPDDIMEYRGRVRQPLYRFDFVEARDRSRLVLGVRAAVARWDGATGRARGNKLGGNIRLFEEPVAGHRYAVAADPATAFGADYSTAYVVDLTSMALVAEFRGKLSEDLFAAQLHYLGRMFGRDVPADVKDPSSTPGFAKLAIETGGGFGNAVIAALRDRTAGRPVYGNLHQARMDNRPGLPTAKPYGFPMNSATRPKVFNQISAAIRERTLPYVSDNLLHEMEDFIEADHGPSPRARDGAHDDCVMAAAIALELYRLHGQHGVKKSRKRLRRPMYPWQEVA